LWRQLNELDKKLNELKSELKILDQEDTEETGKLDRSKYIESVLIPHLENGEESNQTFARWLELNTDLTELDLKHPGKNGLEWCRLLKRFEASPSKVLDLNKVVVVNRRRVA